MGIKVLFLDIDGVVNCSTTKERFGGYIGVEQEKISLIKQIIDATDTKIVLTSTWRLEFLWHKQGKTVRLDTYNYLVGEFAKQGLEFFDMTPSHSDSWRGREIQDWLDNTEEEVEAYAILDDDSYDIAKEHRGHVVQTSWQTGLKTNALRYVLDILNK